MLTAFDDYLVHQTAEPITSPGTGDRNFYDRHFFIDYHAFDVSSAHGRSIEQRIHGLLLRRLPKPDLVVYLDAPGEVLRARKGEGSVEALEQRRDEYRAIASLVPRFVEVDATQPVDAVVRAVADSVLAVLDGRQERDR